jgi:hypothetical protein
MICRKIYETRTHGLCGTTVPGVAITCEHSKTKCSLGCSPQCAGYEESGSTKTPTKAQQNHNREFIEYAAHAPVRTEPIQPVKITPAPAPALIQNNAKNILPNPSQSHNRTNTGGCGCGGASKPQTNYTSIRSASYVR